MPAPATPEHRIAALVDAHGSALLRVARKHSLCLDDAHDAYQRALEIYLRRLDTVEPATEGAWMRVVVRHEAMAVRRARGESVAREEIDFDLRADDAQPALEDRLAAAERGARSAEALRRLKPDEATALMLKAGGHSYAEIAQRTNWSYTKVNRSITEGRARFRRLVADLESGEACAGLGSELAELACGTASAEALLRLRPHLRHCPSCRATVRELRGGRRRVAGWVPLPALLHRLAGSDLVTGLQLAATGGGGGGRGLGVAAVVGVAAALGPSAPGAAPDPAPVAREAALHAGPAPRPRGADRLVARAAPPARVRVATVAARTQPPPARPAARRAAQVRPAPAPAAELGFERAAPVAAGAPVARRSLAARSGASGFAQGEFAP